ncbi:MAG: M20/M25/M40 family metallo-hydrolase [Bacteroidota bacterium]
MYFFNYSKGLGLYTHILQNTDSAFNFTVSLYPLTSGKPNIILLHHTDVVPPGDTMEWDKPPFSAAVFNDYIYGRGTLDAKGLGVMQLMSVLKIRKTAGSGSLPYNVTLLCVSGEETGGKYGAKLVADKYLKFLKPLVILGEGGGGTNSVVPSNPALTVFGISVAEKSNLWLELELKFKSYGHGAAPPKLYVNKSMLKALSRLNDIETGFEFSRTSRRMFRELGRLEGGIKGFVIKHISWHVFRPFIRRYFRDEPMLTTLVSNTTVLTNFFNPPGPPNQISEKATALLDCRLLPGTGRKKFIRDIRFGLFEPRFTVKVLDAGPVSEESSPNTDAYRILAASVKTVFPGSETIPILFPASTDNNYFRSKGIPVYGLTPVFLTREDAQSIHGSNERISLKGFRNGILLYESFLNGMMRNPNQKLPPVLSGEDDQD